MRRRKWLLTGIIVVVGYVVIELSINRHWFIRPPQVNVEIKVSGETGSTIQATVLADGVSSSQTATLPATFRFRVRRLSYTFQKGQQPGNLYADLLIDGMAKGRTGGSCDYIKGETEGRGVTLATCGPGQP